MFRKRTPPMGAQPGAMAIDATAQPSTVRMIRYSASVLEEREITDPEQLAEPPPPGMVTWVDVEGLGGEAMLRRIAAIYRIHPLALADVVNVPQRAKLEPYENQLFVIVRMARFTSEGRLDLEQVSLMLGPDYVITFQERSGDVFHPVRNRLRANGQIRSHPADFLAYSIIDAVIDGYYPVIEQLGESLNDLEDQAVEARAPSVLRSINRTRRTLVSLIRIMWSHREAIHSLIRDPGPLIRPETRVYLRDSLDHSVQVVEVLETYREVAGELTSTYLTAVSNRSADVMKVLTVMASIFIPLTFLAGVYGMNFEYMPELRHPLAYPLVLLLMAAVASGMLIYFRRRGWLGRTGQIEEEDEPE